MNPPIHASSGSEDWPVIPVTLQRGHRVASGLNGDPRFPGGTIAMQRPFFAQLGLDLGAFHSGTLNVSIVPFSYQINQPSVTFRQVRWHPTEPAEDFSFCACRIEHLGVGHPGWVYYPHPATKPEHFQDAHVLEILAPPLQGIEYGQQLQLCVNPAELSFQRPILG